MGILAGRRWRHAAYESALTKDDSLRSPLSAMAMPNFGNLLNKTADDMAHRAAILEALDLELRRRNGETNVPTEVPYDAKRRIVRTPEYACIEKIPAKD